MKALLAFTAFLISAAAFAHNGHHHGEHTNKAKTEDAAPDLKKTYEEINQEYATSVKPIFEMKCAACHSSGAAAPWYASIPIVHGIVEGDRSEAKEHLEISKGFPFAGHGTPDEDLEAINDVLKKGSMPTALYSFMHPSSKLTEDEKTKVRNWVESSQQKLRDAKAHEAK